MSKKVTKYEAFAAKLRAGDYAGLAGARRAAGKLFRGKEREKARALAEKKYA